MFMRTLSSKQKKRGPLIVSSRWWENKLGGTASPFCDVGEACRHLNDCGAKVFVASLRCKVSKGTPPLAGAVLLPHSVPYSWRIACLVDGEEAEQARVAGAALVGSGPAFLEALLDKTGGGIDAFDELLAHPRLFKELYGVSRILGPRGMMPSVKRNTLTPDIPHAVRSLQDGVRLAFNSPSEPFAPVGLPHHTPTEVAANLAALIAHVRAIMTRSDSILKLYLAADGVEVPIDHKPFQ